MLLESVSGVATCSLVPGDDRGREALATVSKPRQSPSASQGGVLCPCQGICYSCSFSIALISLMGQTRGPKASRQCQTKSLLKRISKSGPCPAAKHQFSLYSLPGNREESSKGASSAESFVPSFKQVSEPLSVVLTIQCPQDLPFVLHSPSPHT